MRFVSYVRVYMRAYMFVCAVVGLIMSVSVVCSWCEPNEYQKIAFTRECVLYYKLMNGMNQLRVKLPKLPYTLLEELV